MAIAINGTGTITGISQGGLNDNIITKSEMATGGAWAPAGTVVQVVQGLYATETISSSSSWADTGVTATITPTSSSSKILVMVSFGEIFKTSGNLNNSVGLNLQRNGSDLKQIANASLYTGSTLQNQAAFAFNYLDSPATTSSLTYKVQFRNLVAASAVYVQSNSMPSTITLLEIAA